MTSSSHKKLVPEPPLRPLEIASGTVWGRRQAPLESWKNSDLSLVQALENVLRPILQSAAPYIAFSGGRDSSALLATAVRLARREKLNEPIAITMRWPQVASADESQWQEDLAQILKLEHWQKVVMDDDFDLLGDLARPLLLRHGLMFPANICALVPVLRHVGGSTLITGDGGDQLFGTWSYARFGSVMQRRVRPRKHDIKTLGKALAPMSLRSSVLARKGRDLYPWMRADALDQFLKEEALYSATEPVTWPAFLRWESSHRLEALVNEARIVITGQEGVEFIAPFWHETFLASLSKAGGRWGFGNRTATMRAIFHEVLPDQFLSRSWKANLTPVYWSGYSRQFAHEWDGTGLDNVLVDKNQLKKEWFSELPKASSAILLQAAWLENQGAKITS